jgi:hypothetical protein
LSAPKENEDNPSCHLNNIECCYELEKTDARAEFDATQQFFETASAQLFLPFPSTILYLDIIRNFLADLTTEFQGLLSVIQLHFLKDDIIII